MYNYPSFESRWGGDMRTRVYVCEKRRYRSQWDGLRVLARIWREGSRHRREKGCYFCSLCRGWHLTSLRQQEEVG